MNTTIKGSERYALTGVPEADVFTLYAAYPSFPSDGVTARWDVLAASPATSDRDRWERAVDAALAQNRLRRIGPLAVNWGHTRCLAVTA